ncbi:MAG TPA: hypothetical protein VFT31_04210 [Kribbella sp.]|nr:hypothetical protein [Kribbella sp.]
MTDRQRQAGDLVEIRVTGVVSGYARSLFEGFDQVDEPFTTTLRGVVADDRQLTELRCRMRDAGLELVSLRRLPTGSDDSA